MVEHKNKEISKNEKKTTCDDNKSQNRVKNLVEWRKRSWPKQRIEA